MSILNYIPHITSVCLFAYSTSLSYKITRFQEESEADKDMMRLDIFRLNRKIADLNREVIDLNIALKPITNGVNTTSSGTQGLIQLATFSPDVKDTYGGIPEITASNYK